MPFVSYSLPENNGMSSTLPSESSQISDELAVLASEFEGLEAEYNCSLEHSVCEGPSASPASLEFRVEVSSSSESTPVTSEQRVGELVSFEPTPHDSREQEDVQQFLSDTCKCSLGPGGTPCCLSLSMETIRRSRDKCAELTHNELDLVIMAQIHSLRTAKHEACKGATSSTFRPLSSYYIHGVKICQVTFLFLHRVSRKRYLRIVNLYDTEGLVTSVHGNTGRLPKNTCTLEQVDHQEILTVGLPQLTPIKGLDLNRQWYYTNKSVPFAKTACLLIFHVPCHLHQSPHCNKIKFHWCVLKNPLSLLPRVKLQRGNVHSVINPDIQSAPALETNSNKYQMSCNYLCNVKTNLKSLH